MDGFPSCRGGIRPHNIHELLNLPIHEIHTGSSQEVPSKMAQLGRKINMGTDDDQGLHTFVDEEAIRAIVHASRIDEETRTDA